MAGDQQTPSGTRFDPSPQFWVYEIEPGWPSAVTGRCWFAPVAIGMWFDTVAFKQEEGWEVSPCRLRVEEISIYRHYLLDELDETMSARLVLSGHFPSSLVPKSVLVARDSPSSGNWELQGTLWRRRPR